MQIKPGIYLWLLTAFILHACSSTGMAPVSSRNQDTRKPQTQKIEKQLPEKTVGTDKPDLYVVRKGDTLYSIAWNYGYDYRDVASWNSIQSPYVIYPGQKISLQAPPVTVQNALTPGPIIRKETQSEKTVQPEVKPEIKQEPAITKQPPAKTDVSTTAPLPTGTISWTWPVRGSLARSNTPTAQKGIDISGDLGQPVNAAALGDVVYSGSGLLGYGKLIIIKHNNTYLSAYAHNSKLLVKEGDRVMQGQQIAQMGQTTDGRTLLHFEIRENGKPIDPLKHLPKL